MLFCVILVYNGVLYSSKRQWHKSSKNHIGKKIWWFIPKLIEYHIAGNFDRGNIDGLASFRS